MKRPRAVTGSRMMRPACDVPQVIDILLCQRTRYRPAAAVLETLEQLQGVVTA